MDESKQTFAQLGIPFPLFEAPVKEASEYAGVQTCCCCGIEQAHCFLLGIGDEVVIPCPQCGLDNGLDADDQADKSCGNCGHTVPFPTVQGETLVCYECLRSGRAAIGKDTALGMVGLEHASRGVTHGLPGLQHPDFVTVPVYGESGIPGPELEQENIRTPEKAVDVPAILEQSEAAPLPGSYQPNFVIVPYDYDTWRGAVVEKEWLFELLRTPNYPTWQGEQWQFCCRRPMVFIGEWDQFDLERHSPDGDGRAYFMAVVEDSSDDLWTDKLALAIGIYMFRCPVCGRHKGHWDCD